LEIIITATGVNIVENIVKKKHQNNTGEIAIIKNQKELHAKGVTKKVITQISVQIQKTRRYREVKEKIGLSNSGI